MFFSYGLTVIISNTKIHLEQEDRGILRTSLFLGPNPEWEQVGAMEDISTQGCCPNTNSKLVPRTVLQKKTIQVPVPMDQSTWSWLGLFWYRNSHWKKITKRQKGHFLRPPPEEQSALKGRSWVLLPNFSALDQGALVWLHSHLFWVWSARLMLFDAKDQQATLRKSEIVPLNLSDYV